MLEKFLLLREIPSQAAIIHMITEKRPNITGTAA
jgi:hypothetical protein